MSNNDIFRKELEELETSLVFPDASWNWCYNDGCGWYDITLCLTESVFVYGVIASGFSVTEAMK